MEISNHVEKRYAERIMDKSDKTDITVFIQNHKDKIKEDIEKMIEYGELIYTGRSLTDYNKEITDVYIKDTWVLIVDNKKNKVITLYSIDLGLDKEFNQLYISKLMNQLREKKEEFETQKQSIQENIDQYNELIRENSDIIADYKKTIKSLEEQNRLYGEMIESFNTNISIAESGVRDVVARLIGKKVF